MIFETFHFRLFFQQVEPSFKLYIRFIPYTKIKVTSLGISFDYYLNFLYFMLTLENSVGVQAGNPNAIELNRGISLRAGVKKSHTVQSSEQILQLHSPSLMAVAAFSFSASPLLRGVHLVVHSLVFLSSLH